MFNLLLVLPSCSAMLLNDPPLDGEGDGVGDLGHGTQAAVRVEREGSCWH